jgi:type IV pilus assembly protein PilE
MAAFMLAGCEDKNVIERAEINEAKGALLKVAINQEQFYLENKTFSDDLIQLGFATDPFVTKSERYTINVAMRADGEFYLATATYIGKDSGARDCQILELDSNGNKASNPVSYCWNW